MQTNSSLLFIGLAIGFGIAGIGGLVDYLLSRRRNNQENANNLPGCMLYFGGILGFLGVIAMIISLVTSHSLSPALLLGAGVLGGFYSGFALLIIGYLLVKRFGPN
ncbi:MAG: hypothetical protein ACK2T4_02135 [Candidatus Promineifilaceae bacterium]